MIKILLVEDDLGLSSQLFDFLDDLRMLMRYLMGRGSLKLKVVSMTWFAGWCCQKKMVSSLKRIA